MNNSSSQSVTTASDALALGSRVEIVVANPNEPARVLNKGIIEEIKRGFYHVRASFGVRGCYSVKTLRRLGQPPFTNIVIRPTQ